MVKKVSCKQLTNFPDWLQHRMNAIFLYFMVYILIPFNNFESFTHMPRLGMPDFGITLQFRSFITNYAFSLIEKVKASNTSMVEDTLRGVERVFVLLVKLYRVPALYPLSLFPFLQFFSYRSCRQNRPASQTLNQCSLVTISKTHETAEWQHIVDKDSAVFCFCNQAALPLWQNQHFSGIQAPCRMILRRLKTD